jgi:hypothetical protein
MDVLIGKKAAKKVFESSAAERKGEVPTVRNARARQAAQIGSRPGQTALQKPIANERRIFFRFF